PDSDKGPAGRAKSGTKKLRFGGSNGEAFLATLEIPYFHCPVRAGSDKIEWFAGIEGHAPDRGRVASERAQLLACGGIPHFHHPVRAGGDEQAPIRTEAHTGD